MGLSSAERSATSKQSTAFPSTLCGAKRSVWSVSQGCGKTTLGRCILQLEKASSGEIIFDGKIVRELGRTELNTLRQRIQVVFQDPYSSLNPRMKIEDIVAEPMYVHSIEPDARQRGERVRELLRLVGLNPRFADRYPHEMSGGQRQRVGIARALSLNPDFIVCDEAISALDVSIQAQVINLLEDLREKLGLTYLFIAHDLSVVRHISHRVAVMYLGRVVELASSDEIFERPQHPYTQALINAVPTPDPDIEVARGPCTPAGRGAKSDEPAVGLRVPSAVPSGGGQLPAVNAGTARDYARPSSRLHRDRPQRPSLELSDTETNCLRNGDNR